MGMEFAFIGAGSLEFTTSLARDILTYESFYDAEFIRYPAFQSRPSRSTSTVA